jgi:hypothetical protein
MRVPNFVYAEDLKNNLCTEEIEKGYWVIAKPLGFTGFFLRRRLYLAYCVFTGKYDVLFYARDRLTMK